MVLDVWSRLHILFATPSNGFYPGVQISGLDYSLMERILHYVMDNAREIEPMLEDAYTGTEIYPESISEIIRVALSSHIDGLVWVEATLDHLNLPSLGFHIADDNSMTIYYVMGIWTPVKLISFLELLRWISALDKHIYVQMLENTAPQALCDLFNKTWHAYVNDKSDSKHV